MYQPRQPHGGFATLLVIVAIVAVIAIKVIPVMVTHDCQAVPVPSWQAPCAQLAATGLCAMSTDAVLPQLRLQRNVQLLDTLDGSCLKQCGVVTSVAAGTTEFVQQLDADQCGVQDCMARCVNQVGKAIYSYATDRVGLVVTLGCRLSAAANATIVRDTSPQPRTWVHVAPLNFGPNTNVISYISMLTQPQQTNQASIALAIASVVKGGSHSGGSNSSTITLPKEARPPSRLVCVLHVVVVVVAAAAAAVVVVVVVVVWYCVDSSVCVLVVVVVAAAAAAAVVVVVVIGIV